MQLKQKARGGMGGHAAEMGETTGQGHMGQGFDQGQGNLGRGFDDSASGTRDWSCAVVLPLTYSIADDA